MDPTLSCGLPYLSFGLLDWIDVIGNDGHESFLLKRKGELAVVLKCSSGRDQGGWL